MYKYIKSTEDITAATFSRMLEHMQEHDCCFITAFRDSFNHDTNQRRNKKLENKIRKAGFSFIKTVGGYIEHDLQDLPIKVEEETFFVINNLYTTKDFIKFAIGLCRDIDPNRELCTENDLMKRDKRPQHQESVLVTIPVPVDGPTRSRPRAVEIIGRYYDIHGNITMEFSEITVNNVGDYYTKGGGKTFSLIESSEHLARFTRDIRSPNSRRIAEKEFQEKYPELK